MMTAVSSLDLYPPGVRLIGGRRRQPIRGVLHDVAGFAGIAERGPVAVAVRVESIDEFVRTFGAPVPEGFLSPAVQLFFRNGGRAAWIVRVADLATAAAAGIVVERGGELSVRIEAASPGRWGNRIRIRIEPTSADRFTLRVAGPGMAEEVWPGLTLAGLADPGARPPGLGQNGISLDDAPAAAATLGPRAGGASTLTASLSLFAARRGSSQVITLTDLAPSEAQLSGGRDGLAAITAADFGVDAARSVGLKVLEEVDEVALLACPDIVWQAPQAVPRVPDPPAFRCEDHFTRGPAPMPLVTEPDPSPAEDRPALTADERARLRQEMTAQARRQRDRFAILDCDHPSSPHLVFGDGNLSARDQRMTDGEFGAVYFPWVETAITGVAATVPPSGAMAGIFARTTLQAGPHVAPANERLEALTGLAYDVDDAEHARLNEAHVNVIRRVPGRDLRPMGARTRRRDGPFRQIAIRRLVNFIVETLDEETQWLVFEPNSNDTRIDLVRAVRGFLDRIWRQGMLDGIRPEDAYSVSVDPAANPPESVAAGRLVCELAVRPPWPAEWIRVRLVKGESGLEIAGLVTGEADGPAAEA
jgi:uncharacterized protein